MSNTQRYFLHERDGSVHVFKEKHDWDYYALLHYFYWEPLNLADLKCNTCVGSCVCLEHPFFHNTTSNEVKPFWR